jgi:hypothetical protein
VEAAALAVDEVAEVGQAPQSAGHDAHVSLPVQTPLPHFFPPFAANKSVVPSSPAVSPEQPSAESRHTTKAAEVLTMVTTHDLRQRAATSIRPFAIRSSGANL